MQANMAKVAAGQLSKKFMQSKFLSCSNLCFFTNGL